MKRRLPTANLRTWTPGQRILLAIVPVLAVVSLVALVNVVQEPEQVLLIVAVGTFGCMALEGILLNLLLPRWTTQWWIIRVACLELLIGILALLPIIPDRLFREQGLGLGRVPAWLLPYVLLEGPMEESNLVLIFALFLPLAAIVILEGLPWAVFLGMIKDYTPWPPGITRWAILLSLILLAASLGYANLWIVSEREGVVSRYDVTGWQTFTAENSGLAIGPVRTIWGYGKGKVWIGTEGGAVHRYDGAGWENFTAERTGMAAGPVQAIWGDGLGKVWFGAYGGGVSKYGGAGWESFTAEEDGLALGPVQAIWGDGEGAVWVGTEGGGASRYDGADWQTFTAENTGLAPGPVQAIWGDGEGAVWVGTGGGVSVYDGVDWETLTAEDGGPAIGSVQAIWGDGEGAVWFGTEGGRVSRYAGKNVKNGETWRTFTVEESGLASNDVSAIWGDGRGTVWVGTGGGVRRYDGTYWRTFTTLDDGLASNDVSAIWGDGQGTVWVGTGGGVRQYDGTFWQTFTTLDDGLALGPVQAIWGDGEGAVWIGTGGGVSVHDDTGWETLTVEDGGLALGPVQAIWGDGQGAVWVGTQEGGVRRYARNEWQTFTAENNGLASNDVSAIWGDGQGTVWVGTGDGVSVYDGRDWETFTAESTGLASNDVPVIRGDGQGTVWVGTQGNGVSRYDGTGWETFTAEDSGLASNDVSVIWDDRQGKVWFGTGDGASRYDGTGWKTFTIGDSGLASNDVSAIWGDRWGTVWFGTEGGGVSRLDDTGWQTFTAETTGLAFGPVETIWGDGKDTVWVETERGVSRYKDENWKDLIALNSSLIDYRVATLFMEESKVMEGGDGILWVGMWKEREREIGSPWPALLLAILAFGGTPLVAYQRYVQLPETRADRVYGRSLVEAPAGLYAQIYDAWRSESDHIAVLGHLSEQMRQSDMGDVADIVDGFCALAEPPDDLTGPLEQASSALAKGEQYDWGQDMHYLYRLFSAAYQADSIPNLTALDLAITAHPSDGTHRVSSHLGEIRVLPHFLYPSVPITLIALEQTADTLMKYEQVDTVYDRLSYLADGLNQIEEARKALAALTGPERTVLAGITGRWREIMQKEIDAIRGRAELWAELRTKQAHFGGRVGLVLRLENKGRAVAESVAVTLESSEDYEILGKATIDLARVSTKRPSEVEFTIHPGREDRVRLDFTLTWDDHEQQGKSRRFADTVSFIEVAREFTRIRNPYVAGNPITSPRLFFGRQDVFDFVLENLVGAEQKNTLVLHGQRRTGKSSVLLQLRDRVLPQEFIPVYVNMEALPDVRTMEAFLARLAYEIGRAARRRGLELAVPTDFERPATAFDRFMDAAEDVISGQRFVIMFDEFELIEGKIAEGMDPGVLKYFRNLMQHRDSLIFVFTGTHRLQEMTRDYWSILFSIALNSEISFLEEDATRRLITEPVQGYLEYDDLTIEKIIRVTHCQPYLVQLICWQVVNHLNSHQRTYATINDVEEVLDQILVTAEAYFNSIWEYAERHQRLALALLASLLRPGKETAVLSEVERGLADRGVAITQRELIAALGNLCHREVLEEYTNGEPRYRFQIDLVRMWIEKNKPFSRVLVEEGV